jgi:hypothetical protein
MVQVLWKGKRFRGPHTLSECEIDRGCTIQVVMDGLQGGMRSQAQAEGDSECRHNQAEEELATEPTEKRRSARSRTTRMPPPGTMCEDRRSSLTFCPAMCKCGNAIPQLTDCKATVVKGFGARRSNKSLVAVARIEEGEFITLFGSDADGNATVVTKKEEVEELQAMIAQNNGTPGAFQYTVAKSYTSNTSFTATLALVVPPRDVHQALKLPLSAGLAKTLRKRGRDGIGQLADHTCCEQHVNAKIVLMMYEEQGADH